MRVYYKGFPDLEAAAKLRQAMEQADPHRMDQFVVIAKSSGWMAPVRIGVADISPLRW